jgi:ribokinase
VQRVIVVGSVNVDLVFSALEHLPAGGETVRSSGFTTLPGGKGANQASAAAKLGAAVSLVARVGTDDYADLALAELGRAGVDLALTARVDGPTGVAAVLVDDRGENVVVVAPGANARLEPDSVGAAPDAENAVVLACLEVPIDTVLAWSQVARSQGWTFVLNPAPAQALPDELLANVDVLTPNESELTGIGRTVEELLDAGVGAVVVTRGARGAELHRRGCPVHDQPAFDVHAIDTTGAGDAFNGGLVAALSQGLDLEQALQRGCAAGALTTTGLGARAAQPTLAEVIALCDGS